MNKLQNYVDNLNGMLQQSRNEFRFFLDDKRKEIHLQQAGEKLFSAIESYLTLKYGQPIENYQHAYQLSKGEKSDIDLLSDGRELHRYFYDYKEQFPNTLDAIRLYESVYRRLKDKIRKYLLGRYKIERIVLEQELR